MEAGDRGGREASVGSGTCSRAGFHRRICPVSLCTPASVGLWLWASPQAWGGGAQLPGTSGEMAPINPGQREVQVRENLSQPHLQPLGDGLPQPDTGTPGAGQGAQGVAVRALIAEHCKEVSPIPTGPSLAGAVLERGALLGFFLGSSILTVAANSRSDHQASLYCYLEGIRR